MSLDQSVTTEIDDFIRDKDMHYWAATLSNGITVYEDDDRPELEEKNAWKRLKAYCEINRIHVEKLELVFRSNRLTIDTSDCDGVFFIKSVLGYVRIKRGDKPLPIKRFPSRHFYNIGILKDGVLTVTKYEMPSVTFRTVDERNIGDIEQQLTILK